MTCLLATTEAEIGATPPEDLGGPEKQQKLMAKVTAVHTLLDSAGAPGTRPYRRTLKRGNALLGSFIRNVNHRTQRGKIKADVGERILALSQSAKAQLQPLRQP